ncbi:DUF1330 domain-containing protein [Actinomadura flavalba]|uniref:DUF1330 domain-containing protein n=1 Tax=Actinomadura flavalba TaxID=1120938 RepID=UPI000376078D|nr:DUF1330 domain-containing protein [Actinomadura flavalba]
MPTYALANLRPVPPLHEDVFVYIERIQATLEPFGGRFLVHNARVEVVEGTWDGAPVLIEFPDAEHARAWYASDAYRAILRLRTDHIPGDTIFLDGVPPGYDAAATAATAAALRALQEG